MPSGSKVQVLTGILFDITPAFLIIPASILSPIFIGLVLLTIDENDVVTVA